MLPIDQIVEDLERALRGELDFDPLADLEPIDFALDPVERITDTEGLPETPGVLPEREFGVAPLDRMTNTPREQRIADERLEETPTNFQAWEAATLPSFDRWMHNNENGRIPLDKLEEVPGLGLYRPDAARALKALKRAAKRDGIDLSGSGYRDYATQVQRHQEVPHLAATPGTSNHGWGLAVDFAGLDYGTEAYAWLAKHGKKYGWVNPDWARQGGSKEEPWHWEYQGGFKGGRTQKKPKDRVRLKPIRQKPEEPELVKAVDPLVSMPMAFASVIGETRGPAVKTRQAFEEHQKTGGLGFVPQKYRDLIAAAADKYNLSARLLGYVAQVESNFDPKAVSSAGAQGIMQVMPLHGLENPFNPRANIFKGAEILASYIQRMGSLRLGLAAYNAGPYNHEAGLGYADMVLKLLRGG